MTSVWLDITGRLLADRLGLPADADIIGSAEHGDGGVVRLLIDHPSIPKGARTVTAVFHSIHGATVFDHFKVFDEIPKPCPSCGKRPK